MSTLPENANISQALDKLTGENAGDAENGALDQLAKDNLNAAMEQIKQAMQELEAAEARDASLDLTTLKRLLALTAKSIAVDALDRAEAVTRNQAHDRKIQNAANQITEGDSLLAARDFVGAVDSYQDAVREASAVF
jgi:cellobiose-specific phosphotransferase system component IIA